MMRRDTRLFRLSASAALGALLCNMLIPVAATAQPSPTPAAQPPAAPDHDQGDPPSRVGRIAALTGTVSFRTSADTQWSGATPNFPVASGNAVWTEPSAEATLEISASRVSLAPQTEFDITNLDGGGLQAVAPQGETYFHLANLAPGEVWSVQTPRGQISLTGAGRYDVIAGTTEQPTLVTVLEGSAQIDGPGVSLRIAANETATITGSDPFQGSVGPANRDAFLTARLTAERPRPVAALPPPVMAQVSAMPGGEDLTASGNWSNAPEYGQVWYPPVSSGWVPYRQGHWAYVAPWGWTWVDDAPWGFAPFHYGRWVEIGDRWGWTPGQVDDPGPPVYAPALVTFLGIGAAVGIGVGIGAALAGGSVGWVPLGPREAYHPWYHASNTYIRQVNSTHVTNITNVTNVNNFINRGAATSVPASIMTGSRPVAAAAQPLSPQVLASARPVVGQQPIRPTVATAGVTPAVARDLRLAPGDPSSPSFRATPGPVVRAQAEGRPGTVPPRPALIGPSAQSGGAAPGPGAAAPLAPRESGHPPELVSPGARPAGVAVPPASRPAGTPAPGARPEGVPHPGVEQRPAALPAVERPSTALPPTATPHEVHPAAVPHPQVAAPAASRAEPPRPPHVETPAPHVETPRAPPPRVEPARAPPPPRVEAPRAPPPRVEAPRPPPPRAEPEHPKRPGEP
jgi:hypothetical protein